MIVRPHKLASYLNILENVSQDTLIRLYQSQQLIIIPSIYEGFCIPALEALSVGKAIIGTHTGAIPNIIGNCGILIPPKNENELFIQISHMISNPKKIIDMGHLARQRALHYYQWPNITKKLVNIYKETIQHAHH